VASGRAVRTHAHHDGKPVYRIDWCGTDTEVLASTASDNSCVVGVVHHFDTLYFIIHMLSV
jgi:hypothetical protein